MAPRRSKSQGNAASSQALSARDVVPGRPQYVYRALRKGETPADLRRPAWEMLSALSQEELRLKLIQHVGQGNDPTFKAEVVSASTSQNCVYQLSHEDGRRHLYGEDMVRIDLSAFSQDQVVPLCSEALAAMFFLPQDALASLVCGMHSRICAIFPACLDIRGAILLM